MAIPFDDPTVKSLASQIDAELAEVQQMEEPASAKGLGDRDSRLAKYVTKIEEVANKPVLEVLRDCKVDLCREGGTLNAMWAEWKDLSSEEVAKNMAKYLMPMGFSGAILEGLVVAVSVVAIHRVLDRGLEAFCKEVS